MNAKHCAATSAVLVLACTLPACATTLIPIDPAIFTYSSALGIATWSGNTLTLDLTRGGPLYGGYTQTEMLPTSLLPDNLMGISFQIESTLPHARVTVGMQALDSNDNGQGIVVLRNYKERFNVSLNTFTRLTFGLGGGRTTSDSDEIPIGGAYDPFLVIGPDQNPIPSYPKFLLDFRADGNDGNDYLPGVVTFRNIQWVVVPEPDSIGLALIGLAGVLLLIARQRLKLRSA